MLWSWTLVLGIEVSLVLVILAVIHWKLSGYILEYIESKLPGNQSTLDIFN